MTQSKEFDSLPCNLFLEKNSVHWGLRFIIELRSAFHAQVKPQADIIDDGKFIIVNLIVKELRGLEGQEITDEKIMSWERSEIGAKL